MSTQQIFNIKDKIDEDDSITSLEFHEYGPQTGVNLNNQGEIRITIESQDEIFLPSEAYLTFEGQLQKSDGTLYIDANVVTLTNNGLMYLFNNIRYTLSGQEIESLNNVGQATSMMGMLTYPDDFSKSSGLNQLTFKDTGTEASIGPNVNAGFAGRHSYIVAAPNPKGTFSFTVPLKHIFGFTGDYDRIVYGFKHEITLNRRDNNDAIFRAGAAGAGKVVLSKCSVYMPLVMPSDMEKLTLYKSIESKPSLNVGYRMRQCDTITVPQSTSFSWRLSVKSSLEKPRWVILGFQTGKDGNQEQNPALFDHCNLTNAYVMLNSTRYPAVDYQLNFAQQKYSRMYKEASDFRKNYYGMDSLISNSNINPADYKTPFPLFVFDVSKQSERLKNSITDKLSFMKQFAMCLGVVAILLLNVMEVFSVCGGALLDRPCMVFQRVCVLCL